MGSQNISIPKSKEELTVEWFNSTMAFGQSDNPITSVTWLGAANNGHGALSSLERVTLGLTDQTKISVIIKSLPIDPGIRAYVSSAGFATREVNMYTRVFPDMENFLKERGVDEQHWFRRPKCYFGAEENVGDEYNMILLLEDMFASGFGAWEDGPYKVLDWNHTASALEQIARFQAVSLAHRTVHGIQNYRKIYPFLYDFTKRDEEDVLALDTYLEGGLSIVKKIFQNMENSGEVVPAGLWEFLQNNKGNVGRNIGEAIVPRNGYVSTLCHNDLHSHNVFFSYQNSAVKAGWSDFQACFDGPPMKDVAFFLLMCCDFSLSSTEMSDTIQFYHKLFSEALDKTEVDVKYTLEEMMKDFKKNLSHSVWHIVACAKALCTRPEFEKTLKTFLIGVYQMGYLKYPLDDKDL